MHAHLLSLLLLLASPLAGEDALDTGDLGPAEGRAPTSPAAAPTTDFDLLHARFEDARQGLAPAPGGVDVAKQAFRAQFAELSAAGEGRATAWLLRSFPLEETAARGELEQRLELYGHLVRDEANSAWLLEPELEVFSTLLRDRDVLGRPIAIRLAEEFARASTVDETRARALGTAADLEAHWTDTHAARRARASQRHAEVLARFPGTEQAQASADALWQLTKLRIGKPAPEFVTRDVDGNEIRLGDLRRRVLVVEFWSADDPGVRAWAAHRAGLVERHLDDRFFLLGVNLDADPLRFRRALGDLGIEWSNAFEGGNRAQAIWRVHEGGTNLVLDADGVVRFTNLSGAELEAAVAVLIEETSRRTQQAGALGGISPESSNQVGATQGL